MHRNIIIILANFLKIPVLRMRTIQEEIMTLKNIIENRPGVLMELNPGIYRCMNSAIREL